MAKKKSVAKKVKAIEIEVNEPIEIVISEKEQIKIELKDIQCKLNSGYDTKYRNSLLKSQQTLQIKLKNI